MGLQELGITTPRVKPNASAHIKCHRSSERLQKPLGLGWDLPLNWKEVAIAKMDEMRKKFRSVQDYLDICVRCGACADKCHFFLGTGDPKNMPVARAELFRSVYRKYFTLSGKLFGKYVGARELTKEVLDEWFTYFYQCSECRRCSLFCPYGIDTAEITMAAREVLHSVGMSTKYVTEVLNKVYTVGNNLGIPPKAQKYSAEFLEQDIKDLSGLTIKIPVDKKDADILFVPAGADIFVNTDTLVGYAKIFHAVGANWTMSTYASEIANFGIFFGYPWMRKANKRVVDTAKEWGVKMIIHGECGNAWRAWKNFADTLNGPLDIPSMHICEYTADLIRKGRLKFDKSKNDIYKVTYHDPCNVARAGGANMLEEPRFILKHVCNNFVEMHPDTIREKTFCCGGGGGLLADEIMELRVKGGMPRGKAVAATGANFIATICAICKAQLPNVTKEYAPAVEKVGGVSELVGNALTPYLTDTPGVLR